MAEDRQYKGTDYPRLALDLLKTKVNNLNSPFALAMRNQELGLTLQDGRGQDVMHTLFSAIDLATVFANIVAESSGRTLAEVVDEIALQFELSIPDELRRGKFEDDMRKRDGNQAP